MEHARVGPPVKKMRGAFTGAVTGKKVETREIMPCFTHTYPENHVEVECHGQWNDALNGINSRCTAIPHLRPTVAFANQPPSFTS
jgi:hypothetical protein